MKQMPLPIGFDTDPTFDDFIAGDNALTLECLRAVKSPGPPIYLWGAGGVGKTHLLVALTRQMREQGGQTAWFDAGQSLPWEVDEGLALIVIDGAERLDPDHQHAAFTLFIEAATHGVQVVSAGRMPPIDLPVREDLRTRLGWGPVFAVQPLSEADTRLALKREAVRQGLTLSNEVIDYLLTHFSRDLSFQMRLLRRLERFSLAERRAVTVPLLKRMLAEEGWTE